MKRIITMTMIVFLLGIVSGCGNSEALSKLQLENKQLKQENTDYKNRLTKYEAPTKVNDEKQEIVSEEPSPVELKKIEFDKSGVTSVNIAFQNNTQKTIDAIEFVILQFDNFGRPAFRFNDKSYGNVSGKLVMQGVAQPQGTLRSGWTLYNTERTTKGRTVVNQVHFTDGATWNNLKFDEEVSKRKEAY